MLRFKRKFGGFAYTCTKETLTSKFRSETAVGIFAVLQNLIKPVVFLEKRKKNDVFTRVFGDNGPPTTKNAYETCRFLKITVPKRHNCTFRRRRVAKKKCL